MRRSLADLCVDEAIQLDSGLVDCGRRHIDAELRESAASVGHQHGFDGHETASQISKTALDEVLTR